MGSPYISVQALIISIQFHEQTNILFGGGLDDVWENAESGELHVVDYKSTAQMSRTPAPLDESFIAPPEDPKKVGTTKLVIGVHGNVPMDTAT